MRVRGFGGLAVIMLVAGGTLGCARAAPVSFEATPIIGEIRDDGAIVWARAARPAFLHVALDGAHDECELVASASEDDRTGRVVLSGLRDRVQWMRVWLSTARAPEGAPDGAYTTQLRLAPPADAAAAVTFGFGGDIGGHEVCRDAERGWPLVSEAAHAALDFFVVLGDEVYADHECPERGAFGNRQIPGAFPAATTLDDFRAHYHYAEADRGFSALRLRSYAVWDDHETTNDVAPTRDRREGTESLLPLGRRAFVEHNALPHAWLSDAQAPMYRRVRWGANAELFFLDTRSYRDDNATLDDRPQPKTMLGATQRAWLIDGLTTSTARWLVVVSSVPISVPTGAPPQEESDGWADGGTGRGYERELAQILRAVHEAGRSRLLFVTTDVHFATTLRYQPFDDDPDFEVYELVTGPMGAGLFPTRILDATFHPRRLFFHGPAHPHDIESLDEALTWMTWGRITIDARGRLHYEVRSIGERTLDSLDLVP